MKAYCMQLTKIALALAIGLPMFLMAKDAAARTKWLTVVSWGGAYSQSQVKALHKPFQKEHGARLSQRVYGGGLARIKRQIETGKVTWDIIDVELADAQAGDVAKVCLSGLTRRSCKKM